MSNKHIFKIGICQCGCNQPIEITNDLGYLKRFKKGHNIRILIGKRHPHFKTGRIIDTHGYYLIYMPEHPNSSKRGYIREHRLVYEHYLKILFDEDIYIPKFIDIDHKDKNTKNNSLINLRPLTRSDHIGMHHIKDMSNRICLLCDSTNTTKTKLGYNRWYKHKGSLICNKCYYRLYRERRNNV